MSKLPETMYDYRHENPTAKQIGVCNCCGWGIYIGDTYYEKDEKKTCEDCMNEFKKVGGEE